MTDTAAEMNGRAEVAARRDRPDGSARIAELEAENAALRRALARAGLDAERAAGQHGRELAQERAGRAADAAGSEARHGRAMAAGRADLAASAESNAALRRANAELAASRAALRASEERLRLVLDSAADYAIFTTDPDRRVTSWNAGAERLTGWTEAEIVGRSADLIFTTEDREAGAPGREAEGALRDGRAENERWHARKDGTRFWGSGLVMPLRDPGADPGAPPLGLLKIMRDGTAQRRAEEALRESEARFAAAFAMRTVAVVFWDSDFRFAEVNDAFLDFTGFSRAEALGRTTWELTPEEFYPPTRRAVREMAARGEITPYEKQYFRKDGTRWWGLFAARRVGGEVMEFVLDITERKSAEAALRESEGRRRAALDAARLGTWEWDAATGAAALDGRAREIFGLAPGWGDRADAVFDRIHPADRPRVLAESLAAAAARGRLDTEYRVLLPGGGERAVASLGDALPGAGGRPARMAGVSADITERKRAEERRALLVGELNHRVKNTLAVVQSLALQTARGAPDLASFTAAFQARLIALARAHDLLTREDWAGAPLDAVVRAALDPLAAGGAARVDLTGCAAGAVLPPGQALALALALHELATNAAKHGALSVPGGRVCVTCGTDPDGGANAVEWEERGGPPIAGPPTRRGFGLRLLERGLASQAGMAVDVRFEPGGLRCALRLPRPPMASPAGGA